MCAIADLQTELSTNGQRGLAVGGEKSGRGCWTISKGLRAAANHSTLYTRPWTAAGTRQARNIDF